MTITPNSLLPEIPLESSEPQGWQPTGSSSPAAVDSVDDGEIIVDEDTPWVPVILSPSVLYPTAGIALAAALGIGALNASRGPVTTVLCAAFAACLVFLAVIDARTLRLPNPIVLTMYPFFGAGVILAGICGELPPEGVLGSFGIMAATFAVFWVFTAFTGAMGFGDVKLAGAMGLVLGMSGPWTAGFGVVGLPIAIGGIVSMVLLVIGKRNLAIPFGPFMAAGGMLIMIFPDYFLSRVPLFA